MEYKTSQYGWVMISIVAGVMLFLYLLYANHWGNNPLPLGPFLSGELLFAIILFLFYKLTVVLKGSTLQLVFGIGAIKIQFKIDQLEQTEVIKIPWYYGLGIRFTPKGMIYSIHGSSALRIKYLSDGTQKSMIIGSPEPEKLNQALRENFKSDRVKH
ncbi:MAG TPA: hypothetical protein VF691_00740 [Cytophagaceae bacterium]